MSVSQCELSAQSLDKALKDILGATETKNAISLVLAFVNIFLMNSVNMK